MRALRFQNALHRASERHTWVNPLPYRLIQPIADTIALAGQIGGAAGALEAEHTYLEDSPQALVALFAPQNTALSSLLWRPLPQTLPTLNRAYERLSELYSHFNASAPARALFRRSESLAEWYPTSYFGASLPMVGLYPIEATALNTLLDEGHSPASLIDRYLAGPIIHELCHGAPNPDHPHPWMLGEALATLAGYQVFPEHILPSGSHQGVCGLRNFLAIAQALRAGWTDEELLSIPIGGLDPTAVLGARLVQATHFADYQEWSDNLSLPIAPDGRRSRAWSQLIMACQGPSPLDPLLDQILEAGPNWPTLVNQLPNLLDEAERLAPSALPAPRYRPENTATLAMRSVFIRQTFKPLPRCVAAPADGSQLHHSALTNQLFNPLITGQTPWLVRPSPHLNALITALDVPIKRPTTPQTPLYTLVQPTPHQRPLNRDDWVLSVGSCFAEHIAQELAREGLPIVLNPFGVLYDPLSIANCLMMLHNETDVSLDDIEKVDDRWISHQHHHLLSDLDPDQLIHTLNHQRVAGSIALKRASLLLITLGTSRVYYRNQRPVAQCHGRPPSEFTINRLSPEQIVKALSPTLLSLQLNYPALQVILSVSPIRHLRDGLIENQRSKASLLLAAETLNQRFEQVRYFPAYEILIDELRDYRFYHSDLVHPSDTAKAIVFERFCQSVTLKRRAPLPGRLADWRE